MKHRRYWVGGFVLLVLAGAVWAAVGTAGAGTARHAKTDKITLQLKWVTQAQFAGYYAAKAKGYYKQQNLDVNIKVGGPDITPETVVAGGAAQFGLDWVPNLLATRDSGTKLVDIGQVFQRSGMTEITWKDTGLNTIAKMRGKKVGNWLGGNQWELFAALNRAGMNPSKNKGVKIVKQPFDMNLFMKRQIDAASAMTYNELAQVLETKNPKTGKLTKLGDLNVIKMENIGTGMLEDDIFATESWLKDKAHQDIAKRFLAASFQGWIWCRDHASDCVNTVLAVGRVPHRSRASGGDEAEGPGRRRLRPLLEEGDRKGHTRRKVGTEPKEGDPRCPCSSREAASSRRPTTTSATCTWTASGSPSSANRSTCTPTR